MESALSLSVADVKSHIAFLERVHDDALNRGSSLYLSPAMLSVAVFRYEELWLPMVAQKNDEKGLVPPVDVAWVWHLHRLNPLGYAAFCLERFGTVVDPGASAFRLQSADHVEAAADHCVHTRDVWARAYPAEPFFLTAGATPTASESSLVEPIVATAGRQSSFLWQVSHASYSCESFLAAAIERYDKFLRLMGIHGYKTFFAVPSYDVDLCWHTHMLACSSSYLEETRVRAGEAVDHDDSVNERHEGSKLDKGWNNTQALWHQTYASAETLPLNAQGTSWRGEPPTWWFENRHQRVRVYDDVATVELCQQLLAEIKGSARGDPDTHDHELTLMVPVSSPFYVKILSMMQSGGGKQVVPREDWMETVLMPARVSAQPVLLHQDKWDPYGVSAAALGGADCYRGKRGVVVEGVAGVLYLEGRGSMAFVDAKTGDLEREFEIIPGRLVVWDNVSLFHKVDVADSSTPRVMLGPMSIGAMDTLVSAGGCGGGGCGGGGGGCGGGGGGGSSVETAEEKKAREEREQREAAEAAERERQRREDLKKRIVYECWGYKKGEGGFLHSSAYKKRYFIITVDKRLSYYEDLNAPECYYLNKSPNGSLSCVGMQCTSSDGKETIEGKECFTFTIQAKEEGERIRHCACETSEEREKLLATIEQIEASVATERKRRGELKKRIIYECWAYKKAPPFSSYRKRYLVITDQQELNYYEYPEAHYQNREPNGKLSCVGMQVKDRDGKEIIQGKECFTFTLQAEEGGWFGSSGKHFACETKEAREKLLATIENIEVSSHTQNLSLLAITEKSDLPSSDHLCYHKK